jgi:asparagine synthase (glutamine-hydrolysing)
MAASLEARCPFLDHRVVEFVWRLPTAAKVRNGEGKWALRQVLRRYLPERLFDRPKQGFNVPIGAWLRGPLRDWAQELLDRSRIRHEGFLHAGRVQTSWHEHLNGRADRERELWAILMVQSWLDASRHQNEVLPADGVEAASCVTTPTVRQNHDWCLTVDPIPDTGTDGSKIGPADRSSVDETRRAARQSQEA